MTGQRDSQVTGEVRGHLDSQVTKEGMGLGHLDSLSLAQHLCNTELNTRAWGTTSREDRRSGPAKGYGAWYIAPAQWNKKFTKCSETSSGQLGYHLTLN